MKKQNIKNFAVALHESTRGKKKSDIDATVRAVVGRFGIRGQMKFLAKIEHALEQRIREESETRHVVVRVPVCGEPSARQVTKDIAKSLGGNAEVSVVQDPSLIAGAVVTVGDRRYDGSVKARLRQLRKALT